LLESYAVPAPPTRAVQFVNMSLDVVTALVTKRPSFTFIVVRALSPENIEDMSVTEDVSKDCKSRLVNALQLLNILHMSRTAAVLKLLTSRLVRRTQLLNMSNIAATLAVLKFERSRLVILLQL